MVSCVSSLYWENVDAAGNGRSAPEPRSSTRLRTLFYGERGGRLRDPFGQQWMMSQHKRTCRRRRCRGGQRRYPARSDPARRQARAARGSQTLEGGRDEWRGEGAGAEEVTRLVAERLNAGNAAGVAALYEPEAVLAYPPGQTTTGREAIQAVYQRMADAGGQVQHRDPAAHGPVRGPGAHLDPVRRPKALVLLALLPA